MAEKEPENRRPFAACVFKGKSCIYPQQAEAHGERRGKNENDEKLNRHERKEVLEVRIERGIQKVSRSGVKGKGKKVGPVGGG